MINNVVLVGRLTADPELKTTQSGISVVSFSIAVDRTYTKAGEEKQADFINIVAWRQTAEFICKYFTKGKLIGIEGSIQTRKYQDKNGNNRTSFDIVVNQTHFIGSKSDNGGTNQVNQSNNSVNTFDSGSFEDFSEVPADDDELPF